MKNNAWDEGTVTGIDGRAVIFDCKNEYGLKRPTCDVKKQITEDNESMKEDEMNETEKVKKDEKESKVSEKIENKDTKEEKEPEIPKVRIKKHP